MNGKKLRSWEVRLGLAHVVALIGVVTGSMACAFYLGFFSGQGSGFERAMASSQAALPRLPISGLSDNEMAADSSTEVYANLAEDDHKRAQPALKEEMPALGQIKGTDTAPLADSLPKIPTEDEAVTIGNDRAAIPVKAPAQAQVKGKSATLSLDAIDAADGDLIEAPVKEAPVQKAMGASDDVKPIDVKPAEEKSMIKALGEAPAATKVESTGTKAEPASSKTQVAALVEKPKAKEKEAPVKTETTNKVSVKPLAKGWFAQIASPKAAQDADAIAAKLRKSGFSVAIEKANVRGEEYFRVVVGPESSRPQAERLITQLKREPVVAGEPFLRLIK